MFRMCLECDFESVLMLSWKCLFGCLISDWKVFGWCMKIYLLKYFFGLQIFDMYVGLRQVWSFHVWTCQDGMFFTKEFWIWKCFGSKIFWLALDLHVKNCVFRGFSLVELLASGSDSGTSTSPLRSLRWPSSKVGDVARRRHWGHWGGLIDWFAHFLSMKHWKNRTT